MVSYLQETELVNCFSSHINPCQKMSKFTATPVVVEDGLYEWILRHQDHVNLTGNLIKEKAKRLAELLSDGESTLRFSNGWLEKFKKRHGIRSYRRFGESGSVDPVKLGGSIAAVRERVVHFEKKNVFNMDETGIFFRMEADHSLATKLLEGRNETKNA